MPLENLVIIGYISKPHGVRGEVRLWLDSISADVLKAVEEIVLEYPKGKEQTFTIAYADPHKDFVRLKLKGIKTRNEAETLRDCIVKIPQKNLPLLSEGNYYDFQIIGLEVFTNKGILIGTIRQVWHLPANDVYVVISQEGDEILIPAVESIILDVNLENKKMTIFPMEGLLDI